MTDPDELPFDPETDDLNEVEGAREGDAEAWENDILKAHPEWRPGEKPYGRNPKQQAKSVEKLLFEMEVDWEHEEPITEDHVAHKLSRLAFLPWAKTMHLPALRKDQLRCLELLAKYLKMFSEKPKDEAEHKTLSDEMKAALKRMRKMNASATKD